MRSTLAVLGLLLATPALADDHHHSGGSGSGASCDACGPGLAVTAGLIDVAFLTADIVLLAKGRYLPAGWATVEVIWGAAQGLAGIIATPLGALGLALKTDGSGAVLGSGILLLVIAAFAITHGVKSIVAAFRHREAPPAEPQPQQEAPPPSENSEKQPDQDFIAPPPPPPPSLAPSLAPSEVGPGGTLLWRF
jgi:hypothetical protein